MGKPRTKTFQVEDERDQVVVFYDVKLDDAQLDPYSHRLYSRLARLVGRSDNKEAEEPVAVTAEACQMSERHVRYASADLIRRKMIAAYYAKGKPTRYKLLDKKSWITGVLTPVKKLRKQGTGTDEPGGEPLHLVQGSESEPMHSVHGFQPDPCTECMPPLHQVHATPAPGAGVMNKEEIVEITESVCVARAHEPSASSNHEAPNEITEANIVEWLKECRPDIDHPESYARRAWAGKWTNVFEQVRARQAALAAERRSLSPDAPAPVEAETQVQASALMRALFAAQGWVIDQPTPSQWREARLAETQLAAYAHTDTPARPELVERAGKFYGTQKRAWRLSYLVQDWPQIFRTLPRSLATSAAAEAPEPKPRDEVYRWQWTHEDEEARFDEWWNRLSLEERIEREAQQRAKIVQKLPVAREWSEDVMRQTARAGLLREFAGQLQPEVANGLQNSI